MKKASNEKKILIFILERPFITGTVIANIIYFSFIALKIVSSDQPSQNVLIIGIVTIALIITIILFFIKKRYTTYLTNDELSNNIFYLLKVFPDGKVKTGKIFWGKNNIYKIKKPKHPFFNKKNPNKNGFKIKTKIIFKHQNNKIIIPVSIKVYVAGDYNPQELYKKIIVAHNKNKDVDIDKFVKKIVLKSIMSIQPIINKTIQKFKDGEIGADILFKTILKNINPPKNILSNFKNIKIYLKHQIIMIYKINN